MKVENAQERRNRVRREQRKEIAIAKKVALSDKIEKERSAKRRKKLAHIAAKIEQCGSITFRLEVSPSTPKRYDLKKEYLPFLMADNLAVQFMDNMGVGVYDGALIGGFMPWSVIEGVLKAYNAAAPKPKKVHGLKRGKAAGLKLACPRCDTHFMTMSRTSGECPGCLASWSIKGPVEKAPAKKKKRRVLTGTWTRKQAVKMYTQYVGLGTGTGHKPSFQTLREFAAEHGFRLIETRNV